MLAAEALRLPQVHSSTMIVSISVLRGTPGCHPTTCGLPKLLTYAAARTGIVDDFAVWRRALSASEVATLVASTVQLAPKPAVSFVTVDLRRSGAGKEVGAVQVCTTLNGLHQLAHSEMKRLIAPASL